MSATTCCLRLGAYFDTLFARYRVDLAIAFAVALAVYGAFLFVPGFHLDDELSARYGVVDVDFSLGRWGTSLIRLGLIPPPFNGWFTSLFSLAMLSVAAVTFSAMLELDRFGRRVALIVCLAFPQFAYQLEFHVQSDVIPLGYTLALLSFGLFRMAARHTAALRVALLAASVATSVLALSIYQPIILVPVALCLLNALQRLARNDRLNGIARGVFGYAVVTVVACGAYFAISKLMLVLTGLPSGSSYFTDQFAWSRQSAGAVVHFIVHMLEGVPRGVSYYGEGAYAYVLLPVCVIAALFLRLSRLRCLMSILLLILLVAWPYLLLIVLGTQQAGRTFIAQSFVFAGIWAIGLDMLSRSKLHAARRPLGIVAAAIFLLSGTFCASRLAFADDIAWRADMSTGTRLAADIYSKYPDFDPQSHAVLFYGPYRREVFWHHENYDTFGRSFFEWDDGNTDRIDAFMTVSGIANFHAPAGEARAGLIDAARLLPTWPNPGAISVSGGTIIVHLGGYRG